MNGDKGSNNKKYGFVLCFLFTVCDKIAEIFSSGFVYGRLTSHAKNENAFKNSATVGLFSFLYSKIKKTGSNIKRFVAGQFENSAILGIIGRLFERLLALPARVFGAFTATWGAYALLIELIKSFAISMREPDYVNVACGGIAFLASIPLLISERSILTLASESHLLSSLLINVVGVAEETLKPRRASGASQSVAVVIGIFLGTLTYFIPAIYMPTVFFAVMTVALIMTYPESGVMISLFAAPLLGFFSAPSVSLASIVLLTAVSYLIKVVRGKRVFGAGISELAVYAFMIAVILGAAAPGESNTFENALLSFALMMIFPLITNLMRYKHWIKTCIAVVAVPSVFVSFIGIAQYALGAAPAGWTDSSLFEGITGRAVSVFENPNMLGAYLIAVFPVALMLTLSSFRPRIRILGCITASFIIVCTVFTFSRSAWVALILGGILFAVLITPKGVLWALPAAGGISVAALAFPDTVGSRIINFITLSDSANRYRISVWNSSWNLFSDVFSGGIGMGEEAFRTAYALYADNGTNTVMHSHSLYLQIGIQLGVIGLILFLVAVFSVSRKCASAAALRSADRELTSASKAAISGVFAVMAAGVFDNTWYNFRIMFMFWALLGLACASSNIMERDSRSFAEPYNDEYSAFISVPYNGSGTDHLIVEEKNNE